MNTELTIGVITGNKAPVTLAEAVYIGDGTTKTVKDVLSEGGTSSSIKHNFALTGNVKFTINFTDKTITEVLEACGLPNNIKKYVHLTNLKYNKN